MSRRLFIEDKLEEFYSRCRASSEIKYWIKRGGIEINISLAFVREIVRCSMKSIQKKRINKRNIENSASNVYIVPGRTTGSLRVVNFAIFANVGSLTINLVSIFTKVARNTRKMLANDLKKYIKTARNRRNRAKRSKTILRKWKTYVHHIFI